jgi:hypothetical protein
MTFKPGAGTGGDNGAPSRSRRAWIRAGVTLGAVVVLVAGGLYLESRSPRPGDTNRQGDNPTLDARSSPSPPDLVVQDLSFTDATHAWALGTTCQTVAGSQSCALALQATTDAGSTWNLVTAPPTKWSDVAARGPGAEGVRFIRFAGERDGWVFGPDLFATRDGGQTWAAESAFGEVVALEAVGDSVWLIERRCMPEPCRLSLHASADMGGTWQEQDVPIAGPESSLVRAGRSHAWILSTDREDGAPATGLVATSNGGASWASLPDPCTESAYLAEADLSAVDASNLWLVCAGEAAAGSQMKKVFVSATGGRRWTETPAAPTSGYNGRLVAVSPSEAWLALVRGGLYHTTDGGRTWPEGLGPWGVHDDDSAWGPLAFPDQKHGFVGYGTAIYSSADGVRWERTDLPVRAELHADAAEIYAAVTRSLLQGMTREHRKIFLRSWVGGWLSVTPGFPRTDLPRSTGEGIARDLDDLLPVELADDALIDALYRDILPPGSGEVRDGGVIVTLGAIVPADDGLHVTAGASCASLCGWGTTYVVARVDGRWRVTGTTGSMWIA